MGFRRLLWDHNGEAGAFSSFDFAKFTDGDCVAVDMKSLKFNVLVSMMDAAQKFDEERIAARAQRPSLRSGGTGRKRRLRETHPR